MQKSLLGLNDLKQNTSLPMYVTAVRFWLEKIFTFFFFLSHRILELKETLYLLHFFHLQIWKLKTREAVLGQSESVRSYIALFSRDL